MTDVEIIDLLTKRNETSIKMIEEKYSQKIKGFLNGFLCQSDIEEILNDVLLAVWNSMRYI